MLTQVAYRFAYVFWGPISKSRAISKPNPFYFSNKLKAYTISKQQKKKIFLFLTLKPNKQAKKSHKQAFCLLIFWQNLVLLAYFLTIPLIELNLACLCNFLLNKKKTSYTQIFYEPCILIKIKQYLYFLWQTQFRLNWTIFIFLWQAQFRLNWTIFIFFMTNAISAKLNNIYIFYEDKVVNVVYIKLWMHFYIKLFLIIFIQNFDPKFYIKVIYKVDLKKWQTSTCVKKN